MKVALGQFAVERDWQLNLDKALKFLEGASRNGADLLVMPEGILARDPADPDMVRRGAQPLDGPFMSQLLTASKGSPASVAMSVHVPSGADRAFNTLVIVRDGEIITAYQKLHLYDAFAEKESHSVQPGEDVPSLVDIAGVKVGVMTCYDVRFPELARRLAIDGAEVILLPAAWVRGPGKEAHWKVMVTARALENTCYMVAVGECGSGNIGASMVVDPLGVPVVQAGESEALIYATIDRERLAHARTIMPLLANRRFGRPELAGA